MTSTAERLAHLRTRLAMVRSSHFMLGAGCACGMPASHIDVSTIDSMIASHLADKYRSGGRAQLGELLTDASHSETLSALIGDLINGRHELPDVDRSALADDLEIAVSSLEEANPRRSTSGRRSTVL